MVVKIVIVEGVVRILRVDRGRIRLQRLFDFKHEWSLIPRHPHGRDGVAGFPFGFGHDGQNRLALVVDVFAAQQRFIVASEIDEGQERVEIDGHVRGPDDSLHARHPFRSRGVNGPDPRSVMGRAHAPHMKQAVEKMIVEIFRPSGDMPDDILADRRFSDFVQVVGALVRENVFAKLDAAHPIPLSRISAAAVRIALMIGS